MRCPVCRIDHLGTGGARTYSVTRAGYLALATWRAEAKQTEGALSRLPSQVPAPSSDVAGGVWETTTGADVTAARVPLQRE